MKTAYTGMIVPLKRMDTCVDTDCACTASTRYNYIPALFKSTAHSFGVGGARTFGKHLHNCTSSAVRGSSVSSGCVGPFAFAKGPLLLLSRAVARDAARAGSADVARAKTFLPASRVDDDVILGSLVALAAWPESHYSQRPPP